MLSDNTWGLQSLPSLQGEYQNTWFCQTYQKGFHAIVPRARPRTRYEAEKHLRHQSKYSCIIYPRQIKIYKMTRTREGAILVDTSWLSQRSIQNLPFILSQIELHNLYNLIFKTLTFCENCHSYVFSTFSSEFWHIL